MAAASTRRAMTVLNTVLSFGLNIVIARLGLSPRWRYALWALIVANEIRGIAVVYGFSDAVWRAAF